MSAIAETGLRTGVGIGVKKKDDIPVVQVSAAEIGGEHDKRSHAYFLVLLFVSLLAMAKNYSIAIFQKIFWHRKKPFMKILWDIGRSKEHRSSLFVDVVSKWNHQAKWGATQWPSLTVFYNYHDQVKPYLKNDLEGMATRFWIEKMENRQAVTNRKKLVVDLLVKEIKKQANPRIFSIASGSAEAVITAILMCPDKDVKVKLLDKDESALERAMQAAAEAGIEKNFSVVRATTKRVEEICKEFQPNIVEMVGFLDYLRDEQAVSLFTRIKSVLPDGAVFLTCNILYNKEKIFLDQVLIWYMIYRTVKGFARLFEKSGWNKTTIYLEPLRIHAIAVCVV